MPDHLEEQLDRWGEALLKRAEGPAAATQSEFVVTVRRLRPAAAATFHAPARRSPRAMWAASTLLAALLLLALWIGRGPAPPVPTPPPAGRLVHAGARGMTLLELRRGLLDGNGELVLPPASTLAWTAAINPLESLPREDG